VTIGAGPGQPQVRLEGSGHLAEGSARGYPAWGVFAVRHAGRVQVWRDACPHYGDTPLAWRRDAYLNADASRIVCAAHGAQFDPATGECLLGPCLGQRLTPVPAQAGPEGDLLIDALPHPISPRSQETHP
jgi:nitrite reductase/ring-hydroxylating ferredoxin subunit